MPCLVQCKLAPKRPGAHGTALASVLGIGDASAGLAKWKGSQRGRELRSETPAKKDHAAKWFHGDPGSRSGTSVLRTILAEEQDNERHS